MPKIKTKRAAAKRLKATASGRLKHAGSWKRHNLEAKPPKRKRHGRKPGLIAKADEPRLRTILPYL